MDLDCRQIWYLNACRSGEQFKAQYHDAHANAHDDQGTNFNCGPHHLIPGQNMNYE